MQGSALPPSARASSRPVSSWRMTDRSRPAGSRLMERRCFSQPCEESALLGPQAAAVRVRVGDRADLQGSRHRGGRRGPLAAVQGQGVRSSSIRSAPSASRSPRLRACQWSPSPTRSRQRDRSTASRASSRFHPPSSATPSTFRAGCAGRREGRRRREPSAGTGAGVVRALRGRARDRAPSRALRRLRDRRRMDLRGQRGRRWVVISGDRRIRRNRAEYQAFRASNMVGFFLSPSLQKAPITK